MKKITILAVVLSVVLSGCVKEQIQDEVQEELHEVVFHAGWDAETKTVLQENGQVFWSPGDEICLLTEEGMAGSGYKLTSINTEAVAKTDFIGQIGNHQNGVSYVAIYPYSETIAFFNNEVQMPFPSVQTAQKGTFDKKAFISIAKSDNETLHFHNICSGIKFSVVNENIKEIEFSITSDNLSPDCEKALSGSLWYNVVKNISTVHGISKRLTIVSPNDDGFIPGENYYVVIPAETFQNGLCITYKTDELEAKLLLDDEVTFSPSVFKKLLNKDAGLIFRKRIMSYGAILHSHYMCPSDVDRSRITKINFYTHSDKITSAVLNSWTDLESEPVYFELDGTVANYYTKGDVFKVINASGLFDGWESLQSVDLSSLDFSTCVNFSYMFSNCRNLKQIEFGKIDTSNVRDMSSMFAQCLALEKLDLSAFITSKVTNMMYMFCQCIRLKELDLSGFDTKNVKSMHAMFEGCRNLEKLNIDSFVADNLNSASGIFNHCYSMLNLNMENLDLSKLDMGFSFFKFAKVSRNCAILCPQSTKTALLSNEYYNDYQYIQFFKPGDVVPTFTKIDRGLYYSTDFSKDKQVRMLNEATSGTGIDVVIMGEAYSDRLIENGTYEADMRLAMEQIFSIEPFKSYRNLFNVYMVYAVSDNEVYDELTAFGLNFDRGEEDWLKITVDDYVRQAVRREENLEVTALIVTNALFYGGFAGNYGSISEDDYNDYPVNNYGVGCVTKESSNFRYTVCHEFGHAFAVLHDEYVERPGEMQSWEVESKKYWQTHAGWWSNIDFTSDPTLVRWKHFMTADSPYDESQVSIIEGALYEKGIWKSVQESMMNSGGEYSVPAREAIYKKIHKLSYGKDWQYDFETFVQQDLKNITSASKASSAKFVPYPARVNRKHLFKMEESTMPDGRKQITVIMN